MGTTAAGFTLFRTRRACTRDMTLATNPTLMPMAAPSRRSPWAAPQNRSPWSHAGRLTGAALSAVVMSASDSPTSPMTTGRTKTAHACRA